MPRFRLWSLMIAVAVAALALWGDVTYRRSIEYRELAIRFKWKEDVVRPSPIRLVCGNAPRLSAERLKEIDDANNHQAALYRSLSAKYDCAARRPWFPVSSDPPLPKDDERLSKSFDELFDMLATAYSTSGGPKNRSEIMQFIAESHRD